MAIVFGTLTPCAGYPGQVPKIEKGKGKCPPGGGHSPSITTAPSGAEGFISEFIEDR